MIDHHKTMRQSIVLVGFAASLLLLTITLYVSIINHDNRKNVALENIRQIDSTEARQNERKETTSNSELKKPRNQPDTKVLEQIDELFSHEQEIAK